MGVTMSSIDRCFGRGAVLYLSSAPLALRLLQLTQAASGPLGICVGTEQDECGAEKG